MQNSGRDVIVAVSVTPDCHLGRIHATGENTHLFVCSALLVLPTATANGQGWDMKHIHPKSTHNRDELEKEKIKCLSEVLGHHELP